MKLTNVTIYTLPVGILGPNSMMKAQAIVCAKDPAKLWNDAMTDQIGSYSVEAGCKAVATVERNTKLMGAIGLRGTPAILFADGTHIPGFVGADVLETRLKAAAAK